MHNKLAKRIKQKRNLLHDFRMSLGGISAIAGLNSRNTAITNILKDTGKLVKDTAKSTVSTTTDYVTSFTSSVTAPETGSYVLKVLYFVFLYLFVLFLILVFIHYTLFPVFYFTPGTKGYIRIPSTGDDIVYLTDKKVPTPGLMMPTQGDKLDGQPFLNYFSFSVDILIRKLPQTVSKTRLILYKSSVEKGNLEAPPSTPNSPLTFDSFMNYMSKNSSMIMYLTETNDLSITFFCDNDKKYSIPYIKNVPLYTPFRISCVVDKNMFTVYLNGKHTFQRPVAGGIRNNFFVPGNTNKFFVAPVWANTPTQTVFLHNFHLWPRAILQAEVAQALPSLASISDFGADPEQSVGLSCSLI